MDAKTYWRWWSGKVFLQDSKISHIFFTPIFAWFFTVGKLCYVKEKEWRRRWKEKGWMRMEIGEGNARNEWRKLQFWFLKPWNQNVIVGIWEMGVWFGLISGFFHLFLSKPDWLLNRSVRKFTKFFDREEFFSPFYYFWFFSLINYFYFSYLRYSYTLLSRVLTGRA